MYFVHEPKSIHFWRGNELFICDSKSFHGLVMATPCSLIDCVGEERESMASFSLTALYLVKTDLCHINNHENQLVKEGCKLSWTRVPF